MKLLKVKIREQRECLQRVTLWQWNRKENERQKEAWLVVWDLTRGEAWGLGGCYG